MNITAEFLEQQRACRDGVKWFLRHGLSDHEEIISALMGDNQFGWANWLVTKLLTSRQNVQYAIFSAELAIDIFERKYPKDMRPRNAIRAAKDYLNDPSKQRKAAAAAAAAYAAADAADADAAYAAAAADAAATTAAYAAIADDADDADATAADAIAASYAATAAYAAAALKPKIINYGLELLREVV